MYHILLLLKYLVLPPKGGNMALFHPLALFPHPLILKFMLKNTPSPLNYIYPGDTLEELHLLSFF